MPIWLFVALSVAAFASSVTLRIADSLLPEIAAEFATTPGVAAASVITTFTVAYGGIQIAFGPIGDRFSKRWLSVGCMWAHSIAIIGLAYVTTVPMVLAFATLHGLAWGLRGPQMAAIRADYFGRTHFATILGVSNALIIIGTISGPVIAGYVYDVTNSYRVGFTIVAALAAAGSLFFIMAPKPPRPLASTPAR